MGEGLCRFCNFSIFSCQQNFLDPCGVCGLGGRGCERFCSFCCLVSLGQGCKFNFFQNPFGAFGIGSGHHLVVIWAL